MKLQFDSTQQYQLDAIKSVVDIFEGQPQEASEIITTDLSGQQGSLVDGIVVSNALALDSTQICLNVHSIQSKNKLEPSITISGGFAVPISLPASSDTSLNDGNNFTVEMETGTGKTYVYLRTIHELYKNYGFSKFIIVVPSIAIKEGVIKNLQITKEHFATLYGNPRVDWFVWDSKKRNQARQFATNDGLQIMVMNIDSFARSGNIINQDSDSGVPIEYIKATNPIVIMDEPQNMETDARKAAIDSLNPLCTLRYSATHKYQYNLLYKLDPVKAYDLGLVKKIEVDSVLTEDAFNDAYIEVEKIDHKSKGSIVARVVIDKEDTRGLQRLSVTLQPGDDLEELSGRSVYVGYILDRIDAEEKSIEFTNGKIFYEGQKNQALQEELVKYQIQRTIENHFEKEKKLKPLGIKVLSLFFIDKVSNYRQFTDSGVAKGKFAEWFEEAYSAIQAKPRFSGTLEYTPDQIHDGYFAQDKQGKWKDSTDTRGEGGRSADDDSAYHLIMQAKEKLLDTKTPLRFIFSHSALREGWDNPNVFQICTLNETTSEMKKRQEIGRGLRLPVNSNGERVHDSTINVLTVVSNESYDDFARKLQQEIESETGVSFSKNRIKNKRERRVVKAQKELLLDETFKELWSRIKHQTKYSVEIKTDELISDAAKILLETRIDSPRIISSRARLEIGSAGVSYTERDSTGMRVQTDSIVWSIPDILNSIQQRTKITRSTIFEILKQAKKIESILVNPQQVIDEASRAVSVSLRRLMIDGVKYERIDGKYWQMERFELDELETYLSGLVEVQKQDKTLYDYVQVDSDIERAFAKQLEDRDDVKFYFKLPGWFKIETPLGKYNPDWAIVFEDDKRIYFVAETKGVSDINDEHLSESERDKILCGKRHFEVLDEVEFRGPIDKVSQLQHG
jgi:type III restriction enzyme